MERLSEVHSEVTGKTYHPSSCVRIVNVLQACAYLYNNVQLLDVYPSKDLRTGRPMVVFIFDRNGSKWAYDLWCKHELKWSDDNVR